MTPTTELNHALALRVLAQHLETLNSHCFYDDEIKMLHEAAGELIRNRNALNDLITGERIILPKDLKHAQAMAHVATNAIEGFTRK